MFHSNGTIEINTGANGILRLDRIVQVAEQVGIHILFTLTNNWYVVSPLFALFFTLFTGSPMYRAMVHPQRTWTGGTSPETTSRTITAEWIHTSSITRLILKSRTSLTTCSTWTIRLSTLSNLMLRLLLNATLNTLQYSVGRYELCLCMTWTNGISFSDRKRP